MSIAVTTTDPTNTGVSTTSAHGQQRRRFTKQFSDFVGGAAEKPGPDQSNGKQRADVAIGTNQHGQWD